MAYNLPPGHSILAARDGSVISTPPTPPKDATYRHWVIERLYDMIFAPLQRAGWSLDGLVACPPWNAGMPGISIQLFEPNQIVMVTSSATPDASGNHSKVVSAQNLVPGAVLVLLVDVLANHAEQRDKRSQMRHRGGAAGWQRFNYEKYAQEKIVLRLGEDPLPLVLGFLAQFRSLRLPEGMIALPQETAAPLAPPPSKAVWFLQTNLVPESLDDLEAAIQAEGGDVRRFTAIPFANEPPPMPDGPFFPYGTVNTMERIREVRPECVWAGDDFRFSRVREHHGQHMLNGDAWIGPLSELLVEAEDFPFFLRPNNDDKSFAGDVWWKPDGYRNFFHWRDLILRGETTVDPDVIVVRAPPKPVPEEWRLIVADGQVVAHACYRMGGTPCREPYELPKSIRRFALERIREWVPAPLCAMDVAADTHGTGPKIVEFGSIHSVGLYACDRLAFVRAVHAALQTRSSPACPS